MAKLTLVANPTFKAMVGIPIAGGDAAQVEFTFKHMTASTYGEWIKKLEGRSNVEITLEIAQAWDLADAFNAENLGTLFDNYGGAAYAVFSKYGDELIKVRVKN